MTLEADHLPEPASAGWTVAGLLIAGLATAFLVGTSGVLANRGGGPLPPIALTAVAPVLLFAAAYLLSPGVRNFVLGLDLRLLTAFQLWRVVGFVFLALYAFGALPGVFAWPAGLGDVAVGIAAAFALRRLAGDADFALSRRYLWFPWAGLLDFAVAVAAAALAPGGITSAPMDVWPLNIFPSFLVPLFIILHLMALLKVRHLRRLAADRGTTSDRTGKSIQDRPPSRSR